MFKFSKYIQKNTNMMKYILACSVFCIVAMLKFLDYINTKEIGDTKLYWSFVTVQCELCLAV